MCSIHNVQAAGNKNREVLLTKFHCTDIIIGRYKSRIGICTKAGQQTDPLSMCKYITHSKTALHKRHSSSHTKTESTGYLPLRENISLK